MTQKPNAERPAVLRFGIAAWRFLRWAVVFEIALWRSLFRWVGRRPAVPRGGVAFGYASSIMTVIWVFIGVSAIEIAILHLLLPWPVVRLISVVAGGYGLFWMIGLMASLRVYPHVVGDDGLRVRYATSIDVTVAWDAIATVRAKDRTLHTNKRVVLERTDAGLVYHLNVGSQTNVDVVLRAPIALGLPRSAGEPVAELRIAADDSRALVAKAREHLLASEPSTSERPR